ncbi:hypothetical protein HWV62_28246 [Athelia sp. TMB]|nr:hypothetical protein HWV62_28246 [Athelia sp. TMB]
MSFNAIPLHSRKSKAAPQHILTSHDIKRLGNYQGVPTVTPRRIIGTYTFSAPPGFIPPLRATSATAQTVAGRSAPSPPGKVDEHSQAQDNHDALLHSEHYLKSSRLTDTWTLHVIPSLVPIYLHLLRTTQSLTRPPVLTSQLCTCGGKITTIVVICVYFDALRSQEVQSCTCKPVPQQLVVMGLPPCAPVAPTLAVDLKLLEFSRLQFLTMVPNMAGWCEAMEMHLKALSFKFVGQVIDDERNDVPWSPLSEGIELPLPSLLPTSSLPGSPFLRSPSNLPGSVSPASSNASPTLSEPELGALPNSDIPSPLSSSPPLPHTSFLPPVKSSPRTSINTCFTQKRNKNSRNADYRDTERKYSNTCFLSEQEVKDMETYVESIRARPPPPPRPGDADNHVEVGMNVPASVLDECGNSFVAADEKREKASTQFFSDTGIMSMICRHDRVLFTVNMTHRGERQHYALALIKRFMSEIPDDMTLGLLYDIACQLKHIIYHPRKCPGFGLSDGEGCERFWSSIRKLIPTLRISGYHQRLYTLDLHIQYLTDKAHTSSGSWLARRWESCQSRKADIRKGLRESKKSIPFLREQWALQLAAQTQPMPRRSKHKGRHAVLAVLALDSSISSEQGLANKLDKLMDRDGGDFLEMSEQLTDVNRRLQRLHDMRRAKVNALGISDNNDLSRLRNNVFLHCRMNTLALKQRLRDRLCQRKFELEKLECSYRRTVNEMKSHTHVQHALDRRAPTIQKLAKSYNDLCASMRSLVRSKKAPAGAVCLQPIPDGGLWKLNIDDAIWQDIGLDDAATHAPAPWLKDEDTRKGIRHMLDWDRIVEEERRILCECIALQQFAREEWHASTDNVDLLYKLEHRGRELCRVCFLWRVSTEDIPGGDDQWGPPTALVDQAGENDHKGYVGSCTPEPSRDLSDDMSDAESNLTDDDLAEQVEAVAIHDKYVDADPVFDADYLDSVDHIEIPIKCRRVYQ